MRQRKGLIALDLGAPGLVSVTATLVTYGILAALVLPLGIVGVASLGFDDWGLGLRIVLGILGIVTCLICAALLLWPFIFAAGWRERILIVGGRVSVESGIGRWRRTTDLGELQDLEVTVVAVPLTMRRRLLFPNYTGRHDGRCLKLEDPNNGGEMLVGAWLDRALVGMARDLVVRAKGKTQSALAAPHETLIGPLGWTWARVSGAFGRWARAAWHNPAPVLFDLAVTLGFVLVSALPETFAAVRMAYPAFGVALFAGLALQLRDPAAVLGLAPHPRSLQGVFVFAIGALAVVIGLVSGPTVTGWFSDGKTRVDMVPLGVSVVLAMAAAVLVGKGAFRTATGTEQAPLNGATARLASIVVTFSLIGLTWVHESWAWVFITDAQRGLGPLSVAMTPVVAGLLIWPARFIFLLRTPFDDGPRWAFVWVMGSLVLFSLTGWA